MEWSLGFLFNSILLGVGLAMDAFSVSLANGLHEPEMSVKKMCGVAGVFAGFQALMPMLGWICVHTIVQIFCILGKYIPWIALFLLLFIGGSMLKEGVACVEDNEDTKGVGIAALMLQGIATSIDALSVGFTIVDYDWGMALICVLLIAIVTFIICFVGLGLGKKFGTRFSNKASILGGIILIFIGVEIFITGVF